MEPSDQGKTCPECGDGSDISSDCRACSARPHGIELKVLPSTAGGLGGSAEVKLVRQLKMATVDHLVTESCAEELPAALQDVAAAVEAGDLVAADGILDTALGTVLQGPGHQRRGAGLGVLPLLLWVWCGILVVLLALSFLA